MDTGVFFVVHVWRDARGFHATARDVMSEHDNEFDSPEELARFLAAHFSTPPATTTGDEA
jgi:hypothetical protein